MKIAPVIIWYQPESLGEGVAIDNISSYASFFEKVFIIDNSVEDHHALSTHIPNAIYFPNRDNLGIATALNQGCKKAMEAGFDWAITMDQDTCWTNRDGLTHYLERARALSLTNEKYVSFSPDMVDPLSDPFKTRFDPVDHSEEKIVWTSGNIIKLSVWKELGGFNDALFIDDVDHEYCYRLREKGYSVVKINNSFMNHSLGAHNGVRLYYIARNCLYMKEHYPEFWHDFKRKKYLRKLIKRNLLAGRFRNLSYIFKGFRDARKGRFGKYAG